MSERVLIVRWDEMPRWDYKTARAAAFRDTHPSFRPMGEFVEDATELIKPWEEPEKEWPVYGVNNIEGVVFSHLQKGSDFKAPYKRIRRNYFFHNPTRANVGSLGRVSMDVPPDAITSPEYQVWRIRQGMLPQYVEILIKTRFFLDMIDCHRVGAVKERLFTANLLEIVIPVLTEEQQGAVITTWQQANDQVDAFKANIRKLEEQNEREILQSLDVTLPSFVPRSRAFAVQWSDTELWSAGFNRWTWTLDTLLKSSSYPMERLGDIAGINPSTPFECKADDLGTRVTFVPMEAVDDIEGSIAWPQGSTLAEVGSGYTRFAEEDIIWAKITPCMQNGKSAVARGLIGGIGFGSTEFHVIRSHDSDRILPDYLWALLRLPHVRKAAQRYFTGSAGQQRVPAGFLENLSIPLPSPNKQRSVIRAMLDIREELNHIRGQAQQVSDCAKATIESMIFEYEERNAV